MLRYIYILFISYIFAYHNPGSNCMDCHSDNSPSNTDVFLIGGTIYENQEGTNALVDANVLIQDSFNNSFLFASDSLGNFWFNPADDNNNNCNNVEINLCLIIDDCSWDFDNSECIDNGTFEIATPVPPFIITAEHNGNIASMPIYATSGSCNSCHSDGFRVFIPSSNPAYNIGDVNMDYNINVLDIIFIINVIIGVDDFNESEFILADFNLDTIINVIDIIGILNIIIDSNDNSNMLSYYNYIQPIFDSNCTNCHGTAGGLNLFTYDGVLTGGSNGPAIVPFNHLESELWIQCASGQMPPGPVNLSIDEINLIAQWIDEGALEFPDDCDEGYDECGVCNGDGIQEGFCDCAANIFDSCGICNGPGPTLECDNGEFVCTNLDCEEIVESELEFLFTDEILLYPQENTDQDFLEVISAPDGTMHLVWINNIGNGRNVMYSYLSDTVFSEPVQINQNSNTVIAFNDAGPKIKVRGDELFIIYTDIRDNLLKIYMNYSSDNGTTWSEDILVSDQPFMCKFPELEIDQNGKLHLVYFSYTENFLLDSVRYATAENNSVNFSSSTAMGIVDGLQVPCECCQTDLDISENNDIYFLFRNNINNIRDHYLAIISENTDTINNLIQVSFHNDFIQGCPNSGPSLEISEEYIAISYRAGENSTSYINYSDASLLNFNNEINLINNEPFSSPNLSDIVIHENFIHAGWIDYINGNPNVLYAASEIGNEGLFNTQIMNQNIEVDFIMQKDVKLHWHNNTLYYFWSDRRNNTYQLYFRQSINN